MKAICIDNSHTFRDRLTVDKEYEVINYYNDPHAGYIMIDIKADDGEKRTYRANRFILQNNDC